MPCPILSVNKEQPWRIQCRLVPLSGGLNMLHLPRVPQSLSSLCLLQPMTGAISAVSGSTMPRKLMAVNSMAAVTILTAGWSSGCRAALEIQGMAPGPSDCTFSEGSTPGGLEKQAGGGTVAGRCLNGPYCGLGPSSNPPGRQPELRKGSQNPCLGTCRGLSCRYTFSNIYLAVPSLG